MSSTRHKLSLLLPILLLAPACMAQSRGTPVGQQSGADAASADATAQADEAPRSAFGRVMGVLIDALQKETVRGTGTDAPVRTTAVGTPLGIQVGEAFRLNAAPAPDDPEIRETTDLANASATAPAPPPLAVQAPP